MSKGDQMIYHEAVKYFNFLYFHGEQPWKISVKSNGKSFFF